MADVALEGFAPATPRVPDPPVAPASYVPAPFAPAPLAEVDVIQFWLPGPFFVYREKRAEKTGRCPVPKGRGKVARIVPGKGFATITEHPATKAAEKALVAALLPWAPPRPWEGPVRLDVDFVFTPPSGGPRWKLEACLANAIGVTGDHLGDRDNLHKLLADAMEKAGFFSHDSRITEGEVRKRWGTEPGYRVKLTRIREPKSYAEWKEWPR